MSSANLCRSRITGGKARNPNAVSPPSDREKKNKNGAPFERPDAAYAKAGCGAHDRRENHGSQSADIEQEQNRPQ